MKMNVRTLSLFAAACFIATMLGNYYMSSVAIGSSETIIANDVNTKISEDLQAVLDKSEDNDMVSVYIWTNDIDYDAVERKTVQVSGLSGDVLMKKSNKLYESLTASLAPDAMEEAVAGRDALIKSSKDYETAAKVTKTDTLSLMQNFYSVHKDELMELSNTVDVYTNARRSFVREAYDEQNSDFVESYLKDAKVIFQSQYAPMIICELPKSTILYLDT